MVRVTEVLTVAEEEVVDRERERTEEVVDQEEPTEVVGDQEETTEEESRRLLHQNLWLLHQRLKTQHSSLLWASKSPPVWSVQPLCGLFLVFVISLTRFGFCSSDSIVIH